MNAKIQWVLSQNYLYKLSNIWKNNFGKTFAIKKIYLVKFNMAVAIYYTYLNSTL